MNYSALIQNRKSFREFTDKEIPFGELERIHEYYTRFVHRLVLEIKTQLAFFGTDTRAALEGRRATTSSWLARHSTWCCCRKTILRPT